MFLFVLAYQNHIYCRDPPLVSFLLGLVVSKACPHATVTWSPREVASDNIYSFDVLEQRETCLLQLFYT